MSLILEIVSDHGRSMGQERLRTFGRDGGTIGRSLEADWCLPDALCFLSNRHASIDYRAGSWYIVDTSKNGVFINDGAQPVGRGNPQRLFHGDRIRIGDYIMMAVIRNTDEMQEILIDPEHIDPVDAAQLVGSPEPTHHDLIDALAITGVGLEMEMALEDESSRTSTSHGELQLEETLPQPFPRSEATGASTAAGLDAFFRGAGLRMPAFTPEEAETFLSELGAVTREFVTGVIDCLHQRALQKAQLQETVTVIEPRDNNRLKFAADFEEGFERLFLDKSTEFTGPSDSARDAMTDIRQHQRFLFTLPMARKAG